MAPVVQAQSIGRRFGPLWALRDVTFALEEGETIAVLGEPGSGKTTLLRLICALDRPTVGSVELFGRRARPNLGSIRASIAAAFGTSGLDPLLTVAENISLRILLSGVPAHHRTGVMVERLRAFGLYDAKDVPCRLISPGMRRRLALACSLVATPRLLVLDGLVDAVDASDKATLEEAVRGMVSSSRTTAVVSVSDPADAEWCSRVAVLSHGRLLALDTPEGLKRMVGPDTLLIRPIDDRLAAARLADRLGIRVEREADGLLKVEVEHGPDALADVLQGFAAHLSAVHIRRPTLADAYQRLVSGGEGVAIAAGDEAKQSS